MRAVGFQDLYVKRVTPEAAGAVALTFDVPAALQDSFQFEPGQFITLRTALNGVDVRRSYSICSSRKQLLRHAEIAVGVRPIVDGLFSNWVAKDVRQGDVISVMPPDGSFVIKRPQAIHRVAFAAGSGITPILSIIATTLEEQANAKFTLIYGNRRLSSVMFNEALQDLKDRYPDRFTLLHILSQQMQEVDLLQGRIDAEKVKRLTASLLPVASMYEVFVCGPEAMIESVTKTLVDCGLSEKRIHSERFYAQGSAAESTARKAVTVDKHTTTATSTSTAKKTNLSLMVDGKTHELTIDRGSLVLDSALDAGLDVPFSCKAGVCSTCRCLVMAGTVAMDKNFTLDQDEIDRGYVLSCQARATSEAVTLDFDQR